MNLFVNQTVLAITKDTPLFAPERFAEAGKMILLGMGAVFSVLIILLLVLQLFRVFAYDLPKKRKEAEKKTEAPAAAAVPVVESAPAEEVIPDDGELIAVISAAIAAYRAAEGMPAEEIGGFRVVSFRRAPKGSAWNNK